MLALADESWDESMLNIIPPVPLWDHSICIY